MQENMKTARIVVHVSSDSPSLAAWINPCTEMLYDAMIVIGVMGEGLGKQCWCRTCCPLAWDLLPPSYHADLKMSVKTLGNET